MADQNDLSARADGGPAMTVPMGSQHNQYACAVGMSIRDYFAAHALATGLCGSKDEGSHIIAATAYVIADAMIAARSKPTAPQA